MADYWAEHVEVHTDAEARSAAHFMVERHVDSWTVSQILADPAESGEWRIVGEVDLVASREAHGPVVTSIRIDRL